MNVKKFKRGDKVQLSAHFNSKEWECRCGCPEVLIDLDHVARLEEIRAVIGKPFKITSGYRCPSYNRKIGGAKKSQHMEGVATDIQIGGVTPKELADVADAMGFGGVGRYRTFTHLDSRKRKARWGKN